MLKFANFVVMVTMVVLMAAQVAWGTEVCQQIGNVVYCTDYDTGARVTCQVIGTTTYCN